MNNLKIKTKMIIKHKTAKKLGIDKDVDIELMVAEDIVASRGYNIGLPDYTSYFGLVIFTIFLLGIISSFFISKTNAYMDIRELPNIQRDIRTERLYICQEAYKKSGINKRYIYDQIPAVRCATYMSLVYAYESNFGKSQKCISIHNCFGMKGNGYDTPSGFLNFKNETEGRKYFAKKYFKFHYKKKISQFVYTWSMTDRSAYIHFINNKWSDLYIEIERQYFTY